MTWGPLPGVSLLTEEKLIISPPGSIIITVNKTTLKAYQYTTTGKRNIWGQTICQENIHFGCWFFDRNWVYMDSPEVRTILFLRDTPITIEGG
jgi:hypothetical protein